MTKIYQTGKLPAKFPKEIKYADAYLAAPLPTAPDSFDGTGEVTNWGMLGNGPDPTLTVNNGQPVGDCSFASREHLEMAQAGSALLNITLETSDQLVTEYLAYTGGQDVGAVLSDLLSFWYKKGLISGYAPVPLGDPKVLNNYLFAFKGLYCGVQLPDNAQTQFPNSPWALDGTQPNPNEGHAICRLKFDPTYDYYVTWGALQPADKAWSQACVDEVWIIITPELAQTNGVNLTALQADIEAIPGGQETNPTGPTGPPTPAPAPAPVPTPTPVIPAPINLSWWQRFVAWLNGF